MQRPITPGFLSKEGSSRNPAKARDVKGSHKWNNASPNPITGLNALAVAVTGGNNNPVRLRNNSRNSSRAGVTIMAVDMVAGAGMDKPHPKPLS